MRLLSILSVFSILLLLGCNNAGEKSVSPDTATETTESSVDESIDEEELEPVLEVSAPEPPMESTEPEEPEVRNLEIDWDDPFIREELRAIEADHRSTVGLSAGTGDGEWGVDIDFGHPDGATPAAKPQRTIEEIAQNYLIEVKCDSALAKSDHLVVSWNIFIPEIDHVPEDLPGQVEAWKPIDASIGNYVRVTIDAPDFVLSTNGQEQQSSCIRLTKNGANDNFNLKPLKRGLLRISVTAEIYEKDDCSGASVPISTRTLDVEVRVNYITSLWDALDKIVTSVIDDGAEFIIGLFGVLFAYLLFRFRRRLFGNNDPEGNNPMDE
ncbi:hypothetical protein HZ996_05755 [Cryomorphaceae bacterium]|nr:hypothetical protein HZ996_05755 [Cryomorphaceae bacterium]